MVNNDEDPIVTATTIVSVIGEERGNDCSLTSTSHFREKTKLGTVSMARRGKIRKQILRCKKLVAVHRFGLTWQS